ncbi:MAG TPA: RNA methyltransferase [Gaiellales bacterium]|nr:RNA methyltransferase [Gaiellales bacterium]
MEPITSRANARLKAARRLQAKRHRTAAGLFLAEGEDIVEEALAAGVLPAETFVAADRPPPEELVARLARGGPVHVVADPLLAELGSLGHPARVICVFRRGDLPQRDPGATLGVYLHRVIDPGNVGTLVRAAGALGPAFVALSAGCSDPLSGKGVRASMGAVFRVPIEQVDEPPAAGRHIALDPGGGRDLWQVDLTGPVLLLVGAERLGLPEALVSGADEVARIPQVADAESLNAAAAATVALYEAVRQRAAA